MENPNGKQMDFGTKLRFERDNNTKTMKVGGEKKRKQKAGDEKGKTSKRTGGGSKKKKQREQGFGTYDKTKNALT